MVVAVAVVALVVVDVGALLVIGTPDAFRSKLGVMQPVLGPDTKLKDNVNACSKVQLMNDFSQQDEEPRSYEKNEQLGDS